MIRMVTRDSTSLMAVALALTVASLSPGRAWAQAVPSPAQPTSVSVTTLRFPRLMLGAGVGSAGIYDRPQKLQTISGQFLLSRHFAVEGDVSRWGNAWDSTRASYPITGPQRQVVGVSGDGRNHEESKAWSAGGSLLYRSEPRRVSWYAGGGPAFWRYRSLYAIHYDGTSCVAGYESYCSFYQKGYSNDIKVAGPVLQGLTGVDVQVVGPMRAYVDLRFGSMDKANLQVSTGVRIVALTQRLDVDTARRARRIRETRTAPVAPAVGKDIRVSLTSGEQRRGKLLSLTDRDVSLRQGNRDLRYPLDQVLIVETVSHGVWKGALIGALGGVGLSVAELQCNCDYGPEVLAWPGVGAAIGAAVGAIVNASNGRRHVIYLAPGVTASVRIQPTVGLKRAGLNVSMRW